MTRRIVDSKDGSCKTFCALSGLRIVEWLFATIVIVIHQYSPNFLKIKVVKAVTNAVDVPISKATGKAYFVVLKHG